MSLAAEVRVYDPTGVTLLHTFADGDVLDLQWSDEVGGGGACSFTIPTVLMPTPTLLDDCVVKIAVVRATETVEVAAYAVRGNSRTLTIGSGQVQASGVSLLQAWGNDATIHPEFGGTTIPRSAGEQRGLGWMGSMYDPAGDTSEAWDGNYETDRTRLPDDPAFPTDTGAKWITVHDPEDGDRKLLRSWLTVTAENTLLRFYFSSDEGATLWAGGEQLIQTDDVEVGKRNTHKADRIFQPGTYALAVDTATHISKGGDGVDPILLAVAELDDDGDVASWLAVSDASWVACRRTITGPGSTPPGPTPGAIIVALAGEASDRGVATWAGLTLDFDGALDSDGTAWTTTEERVVRYAFDAYASVIEGLGDVACDVRITPDRVLQARVFEGTDKTSVQIAPRVNIESESETLTPVVGTVADAYTVDGWITVEDAAATAAVGRREFALSLGTAPSLSQGERIATQALVEAATTRVDGDVEFIAVTGCEPYADFLPGDTVTVVRDGGNVQRRILSLSGKGGRPIHWSAELGEAFK